MIVPLGFIAFVGAGIWTLIVSIVMWQRAMKGKDAATTAPAIAPA
ncbi:MAG TPA: hypothetical protein VF094_06075 [Gaiellaceae bacterium]